MVLGMVRLGATSGYAIKKAADRSTQFFWPTSLAQVYPALAELERHGLVSRRDDTRGARARSAYEMTPQGEAALVAWLTSEREEIVHFRDEGLLRVFFADALAQEGQLALIQRLRGRASSWAAVLKDVVAAVETHGAYALPPPSADESRRFALLTARFSADMWKFIEQWLAQVEAELLASAGEGSVPSVPRERSLRGHADKRRREVRRAMRAAEGRAPHEPPASV